MSEHRFNIPALREAMTTEAREFRRCCDEPWGDFDLLLALVEAAEALDDLALVFPSQFGDEPELVRARVALARFVFDSEEAS